MPVSSFPIPGLERLWLLEFIRRLGELVREDYGLSPQVFLQIAVLEPSGSLKKEFLNAASDLRPVLGLSRRPETSLPSLPAAQDIKDLQEGRKKFNFSDYASGYSYWLRTNAFTRGLDGFWGQSGMTLVFMKPDPKGQPPDVKLPKKVQEHPMFKQINLPEATAAAFALLAEFPKKSKEVFGLGLEDDPQFKGLIYILPELTTADFFSHSQEQISQWFRLFDLYIRESPEDRGILMASTKNFETDWVQLLRDMRNAGLKYPLA